MSVVGNIIKSPNVLISEIKTILNIASYKLKNLCQTSNINVWARSKPYNFSQTTPLTESDKSSVNYGFGTLTNNNGLTDNFKKMFPDLTEGISTQNDLNKLFVSKPSVYDVPSNHFRMADFDGYNHNSKSLFQPEEIEMIDGTTMTDGYFYNYHLDLIENALGGSGTTDGIGFVNDADDYKGINSGLYTLKYVYNGDKRCRTFRINNNKIALISLETSVSNPDSWDDLTLKELGFVLESSGDYVENTALSKYTIAILFKIAGKVYLYNTLFPLSKLYDDDYYSTIPDIFEGLQMTKILAQKTSNEELTIFVHPYLFDTGLTLTTVTGSGGQEVQYFSNSTNLQNRPLKLIEDGTTIESRLCITQTNNISQLTGGKIFKEIKLNNNRITDKLYSCEFMKGVNIRNIKYNYIYAAEEYPSLIRTKTKIQEPEVYTPNWTLLDASQIHITKSGYNENADYDFKEVLNAIKRVNWGKEYVDYMKLTSHTDDGTSANYDPYTSVLNNTSYKKYDVYIPEEIETGIKESWNATVIFTFSTNSTLDSNLVIKNGANEVLNVGDYKPNDTMSSTIDGHWYCLGWRDKRIPTEEQGFTFAIGIDGSYRGVDEELVPLQGHAVKINTDVGNGAPNSGDTQLVEGTIAYDSNFGSNNHYIDHIIYTGINKDNIFELKKGSVKITLIFNGVKLFTTTYKYSDFSWPS